MQGVPQSPAHRLDPHQVTDGQQAADLLQELQGQARQGILLPHVLLEDIFHHLYGLWMFNLILNVSVLA